MLLSLTDPVYDREWTGGGGAVGVDNCELRVGKGIRRWTESGCGIERVDREWVRD